MKLMVVISIVFALSKFTGIVPANVFQNNVNQDENRSLLNLVDSAIVTYFCNNPGHLPDKLDDIEDLGVDKGVLDAVFEYSTTYGQPKFSLKIRETGEYSANSNRELISTALDFSQDENGASVTVNAEPDLVLGYKFGSDERGSLISFITHGANETVTIKDLGLWVNYGDDSSSNRYTWEQDENKDGGLKFSKNDYNGILGKEKIADKTEDAITNDKQLRTFADAVGVNLENFVVVGTNMTIDEYFTNLVTKWWRF